MNKFNLCALASVLLWLIVVVCLTAKAEDEQMQVEPAPSVASVMEDIEIRAALIEADLDKPAAEPVVYSEWFRQNAQRLDDCEITHYCCEKRKHICGTGDGITSTGVPVTANWTCAVDQDVIPYGADVMVDHGDRVSFWSAQDCGGSVKGNHIDLAVETHSEALEAGTFTAAVYWMVRDE